MNFCLFYKLQTPSNMTDHICSKDIKLEWHCRSGLGSRVKLCRNVWKIFITVWLTIANVLFSVSPKPVIFTSSNNNIIQQKWHGGWFYFDMQRVEQKLQSKRKKKWKSPLGHLKPIMFLILAFLSSLAASYELKLHSCYAPANFTNKHLFLRIGTDLLLNADW